MTNTFEAQLVQGTQILESSSQGPPMTKATVAMKPATPVTRATMTIRATLPATRVTVVMSTYRTVLDGAVALLFSCGADR